MVQIPPGERDLSKATPAAVTGILAGDRIMVSFVAGMAEARRIVLISSRDIAKRNEAEKLDWQKRGISGIAASQKGSEITRGDSHAARHSRSHRHGDGEDQDPPLRARFGEVQRSRSRAASMRSLPAIRFARGD